MSYSLDIYSTWLGFLIVAKSLFSIAINTSNLWTTHPLKGVCFVYQRSISTLEFLLICVKELLTLEFPASHRYCKFISKKHFSYINHILSGMNISVKCYSTIAFECSMWLFHIIEYFSTVQTYFCCWNTNSGYPSSLFSVKRPPEP